MRYLTEIARVLALLGVAVFATTAVLTSANAASFQKLKQLKRPSVEAPTRTKQDQRFGIKSHRALSRSLRSVSRSRLNSITAGNRGRLMLGRVIGANNFIGCSGDLCICTGDRDCNDLFSGQCKSPSSGGACAGSGASTICYCTPKFR